MKEIFMATDPESGSVAMEDLKDEVK